MFWPASGSKKRTASGGFCTPCRRLSPFPNGPTSARSDWRTRAGQAVPLRLVAEDAAGPNAYRLDFAVFLDPLSETDLVLSYGGLHTTFDDPLQITRNVNHGWQSVQKRFRLETDADGAIERVVYDGVEHLRGRLHHAQRGGDA